MNGIFNSIFWFISPLPAAFLYNYTLAYLLALKRKKMFSLVISLISFAFSTFCFLCPGLPYRQFLNPIVQYSFLGVCCLLLSKHSLQRVFGLGDHHRRVHPAGTTGLLSLPLPTG